MQDPEGVWDVQSISILTILHKNSVRTNTCLTTIPKFRCKLQSQIKYNGLGY